MVMLDTIKAMTDGTALGAGLLYMSSTTHAERLEAVRRAVDHAYNELEVNRHVKQELSEDQLTIEICHMLRFAGFDPRHDEQLGGHCDIIIRGKDMFLWYAEAKKHTTYNWLDMGFKQLSDRYSTGVIGQDQGEVIIYCWNRDSRAMINTWREELAKRNHDVTTHDDQLGNPLCFWSEHPHSSTGLPFRVRHKIVSLHFSPTDRQAA